jgi:Rps23 Pro-64 3,4-dihydroxylase Tpa1-like proline 4-hydroxylase
VDTAQDNDLYQFRQSKADLASMTSPAVTQLRTSLYSAEFRAWIHSVSGVHTNDTVDMSCAMYDNGSYLLCHDDDLAERRIAYILYFVSEEWDASDGGSLDLYAADADSRPTVVTKRIVPQWNSFAMFAVSSISHHQVTREVCVCVCPCVCCVCVLRMCVCVFTWVGR